MRYAVTFLAKVLGERLHRRIRQLELETIHVSWHPKHIIWGLLWAGGQGVGVGGGLSGVIAPPWRKL